MRTLWLTIRTQVCQPGTKSNHGMLFEPAHAGLVFGVFCIDVLQFAVQRDASSLVSLEGHRAISGREHGRQMISGNKSARSGSSKLQENCKTYS